MAEEWRLCPWRRGTRLTRLTQSRRPEEAPPTLPPHPRTPEKSRTESPRRISRKHPILRTLRPKRSLFETNIQEKKLYSILEEKSRRKNCNSFLTGNKAFLVVFYGLGKEICTQKKGGYCFYWSLFNCNKRCHFSLFLTCHCNFNVDTDFYWSAHARARPLDVPIAQMTNLSDARKT